MKRVLDRGRDKSRTKHKSTHGAHHHQSMMFAAVDEQQQQQQQPQMADHELQRQQQLQQEQLEFARQQAEQQACLAQMHNVMPPLRREEQDLRLQRQRQQKLQQHKVQTQVRTVSMSVVFNKVPLFTFT